MGARNRTQQNLEIVRTDAERGLLFVKGSVPGSKGGWLLVRDAVKVAAHADAPYPVAPKVAKADVEHNEVGAPVETQVEAPAADASAATEA